MVSDTDSNGSRLLVQLNCIFQLILHSSQWKQVLINYNLLLLFRAFFYQWTPLMKLNVGQFLKKTLFLLVETIFLDFCRYSCQLKQVIPSSRSEVFIKFFTTTSEYGFWVNFKPYAVIQSFSFCCWKALLKLGVNQFSLIFSVPNSESSFSGQWKRIFYRMLFIPTSGNGFFFLTFFYSEQICGNHYSN